MSGLAVLAYYFVSCLNWSFLVHSCLIYKYYLVVLLLTWHFSSVLIPPPRESLSGL
jgi:hypothetical protein